MPAKFIKIMECVVNENDHGDEYFGETPIYVNPNHVVALEKETLLAAAKDPQNRKKSVTRVILSTNGSFCVDLSLDDTAQVLSPDIQLPKPKS